MKAKGKAALYWQFMLFGGAAFWSLDILVHWLPIESGTVWAVVPFVVPIVFFTASAFYLRRPECIQHSIGFPAFTLAGIWFFGPPAMWLGMLPEGNFGDDGRILEQLGLFFITWATFPITTFIMSAYQGSMGALLFVTPILCIIIMIASIHRWRNRKHA